MDNKQIYSGTFTIERKQVVIDAGENRSGKFLRITEYCNGRRNTCVIPETGVAQFAESIIKAVEALRGAGK